MQCECNYDNESICSNCGSRTTITVEDKNYIQLGSGKISKSFAEHPCLGELIPFQFSDTIKMKITRLYYKVTDGKSKRNGPRRATIYACIIAVCKKKNIPFDTNTLQKQLDISKKEINKVMKDLDPVLGHYRVQVTISDILTNILKSCNMQTKCLPELLEIHDKCVAKSPLLNGSKPETLAAGLVFYYLRANLQEFQHEPYFNGSKVARDTIILVANEFQKCLTP